MSLLLIQTPTGENALVVNDHLIISGESTDDSHNLVTTVAERLAAALNEGLSVLDVEPPRRQGWGWEDVINQVRAVSEITKAPSLCGKCGSYLHNHLCPDLSCPYSTWPQQVALSDMESMSAEELAAKYELIRAEAHSDDRVIECAFNAADWFIGASDDDILTLAEEEWSCCEIADSVALHFETNPSLAVLFTYIHQRNSVQREIGFECTVVKEDAMAWLRHHRYGVWARIICEAADVSLIQAQEIEIAGMWDWLGPQDACDSSFNSPAEAAFDAVERLGLDKIEPSASPLYLAYWSSSAFFSVDGEDSRQIVGPALFCEAMAYDTDDIAGISHLAIGATWTSGDYGPDHTVRRLR
jgi:hypothetical protein